MNKTELSKLKKGFKVDNEGALSILAMSHTYCKQGEGLMKPIFTSLPHFDSKDDTVQEKYLTNFKKLLTGKFSEKLFELEFNVATGADVQDNLYQMLDESNFEDCSKELVERLLEKLNYGSDVLITTILGQAYLPKGKKKSEGEADDDNYHRFMFCSINNLQESDKGLELDIVEKDLIEQSSSIVVNMSKPIEGFMFPTVCDYRADVNKLMYCTTKANNINTILTKEVLQCEEVLTAKDEKEIFQNVLKDTLGETVSLQTLTNIYETLGTSKKETEDGTISVTQLGDILEDNGVSDAKKILSKMPVTKDTPIRVDNLIPTGSKGIKINNSEVTIAVGSSSMSNVTQGIVKGKKCLVIEITEDVNVEGFKII